MSKNKKKIEETAVVRIADLVDSLNKMESMFKHQTKHADKDERSTIHLQAAAVTVAAIRDYLLSLEPRTEH